jgi:hypothetical protein
MSDEKKIMISGTGNRYLINKLKKDPTTEKIRKVVGKLGLPAELYSIENQLEIIQELYQKTELSLTKNYKLIVGQLDAKLTSYKHQDILKKRYNESLFISTADTIKILHSCALACYYCKDKTSILYDIVREMNQWTLDRINNDLGHNTDNVVISCLECNLKRRRTGKDAFLFTKQLNIVKS